MDFNDYINNELNEHDKDFNIEKDDSRKIQRNKNFHTTINDIEFEWDTLKNEKTIKKHGISFEEAAEIFANTDTIFEYDEDHSDLDEDRWNAIGYSPKQRMLIVCHCYKDDDIVRIISARKADAGDIALYNQNN